MVRDLALEHRPKVIVAGATAYPRIIDFEAFAASRRMRWRPSSCVDMAHIAGLVAGGAHPSPVPHADVVTTTTHKTLRGPRGGMILMKKKHRKAINKAVFPGLQGGPHNHTTARHRRGPQGGRHRRSSGPMPTRSSTTPSTWPQCLKENGFDLVSGGTDNHLILVDVTKQGHHRQALRQGPRRGRHRLQLQHGALRSASPRWTRAASGWAPRRSPRGAWANRRWKNWPTGWRQVSENLENEEVLDRIQNEVKELCAAFPGAGNPELASPRGQVLTSHRPLSTGQNAACTSCAQPENR